MASVEVELWRSVSGDVTLDPVSGDVALHGAGALGVAGFPGSADGDQHHVGAIGRGQTCRSRRPVIRDSVSGPTFATGLAARSIVLGGGGRIGCRILERFV